MKKLFLLCFLLLAGCLSAPEKSFQIEEDSAPLFVPVQKIETVSMVGHFDALPHVENQMPISPEEAIIRWTEKSLSVDEKNEGILTIVIQKAEMIRQDKENKGWFSFDEEIYTLSYVIEIQLKQNDQIIKTIPVQGKGFIDVAQKASLAQKEKGWSWLIQKMLIHLKEKLRTEFNDVSFR